VVKLVKANINIKENMVANMLANLVQEEVVMQKARDQQLQQKALTRYVPEL